MNLQGQRVAVLATDGVEQVELTKPVEALREAGAQVEVVAPSSGSIQGFDHHDPGESIAVDHSLSEADAAEYDALVLPGGVINPDALRIDDQAVGFVRSFVEADKPIAAICHGPWTLIEAGGVNGRRMAARRARGSDRRPARRCDGGRRPGSIYRSSAQRVSDVMTPYAR